jgi:hypothetical protein
MKEVTVKFERDLTAYGEEATKEDRSRWIDNISEEIARQFGVKVHQVLHDFPTRCDDSQEVQEWLRGVMSGDEWTQYL